MSKTVAFFFLNFFFLTGLFSQDGNPYLNSRDCCPDCTQRDVYRFQDPIYSPQQVVKTNFVYTPRQVDWAGNNYTLSMDVYDVPGCVQRERPIVILAHGGAFLCGKKEGNLMVQLCTDLARRGYVAASIDYRMGWINNAYTKQMVETNPAGVRNACKPPNQFSCQCTGQGAGVDCNGDATSIYEAVYRAVQDGKSAIRFAKSKKAEWNIDTSNIFFGGVSAGGTMALHMAYVDQSNIPEWMQQKLGPLETGHHLEYSSKFKGAINYWGGMLNIKFINNQDYTPLLMFHGTCDKTVPYFRKRFVNCSSYPIVFGSYAIHNHIIDNNIPIYSEMQTGCGYEHGFQVNCNTNTELPAVFDSIVSKTGRFLYKIISSPGPDYGVPVERFFNPKSCYCGSCHTVFAFPNPDCAFLAAGFCPGFKPPFLPKNPYTRDNPCNLPFPCPTGQ